MSIIDKNLGNAKKHNGQILEHNRHKPNQKQALSTTKINYICIIHNSSLHGLNFKIRIPDLTTEFLHTFYQGYIS